MRRNLLNSRTARPSVPVLRTPNRPTLVHTAPVAPVTVAPVAPVTVAPVVNESNDGIIYCFRGGFFSATETVAFFFASLRLQFLNLPQTTIFNKIYFNWNIETSNGSPVSQIYSVNAFLLPIFRSTDAEIVAFSTFSQVLNSGEIILPKGQELGVFLPLSSFDEFAQLKITIAKNDLTALNTPHNFSCSLVLLYKR